MKKEIESLSTSIGSNHGYLNAFETDISDTYRLVNAPKPLKQGMLKLYSKYVQNDDKGKKANSENQAEFNDLRKHLETTIKGLRDKFTKNMKTHQKNNRRIMNDNVELIKEINVLKREKKNLIDNLTTKRQRSNSTELALDSEIKRSQEILTKLADRASKMKEENSSLKESKKKTGRLQPLEDPRPVSAGQKQLEPEEQKSEKELRPKTHQEQAR